MKLISMTDYVLEQSNNENLIKHISDPNEKEFMNVWVFVFRYAQFLKTPLELGMFVPCDEKGNVLEEPLQGYPGNEQYEGCEMDEYIKAKKRVVFENCSMFDKYFIRYGNGTLFHIDHLKTTTIEFLCDRDLSLTQNAIKKYGL